MVNPTDKRTKVLTSPFYNEDPKKVSAEIEHGRH